MAATSDLNSEPQIYGKTAITVDMKTGEIIYAKDIDKQMYPASTTKLLTALLLAENKNKTDILKYTQDAKDQPEDSINLNLHSIDVGEGMTAADAMDGLLVFSGNDMAYMIAENVSKTAQDFVDKMNEEVKKLGLKNTHFANPNGLHDPNHYTTAYDLSVIARTAFQNPWVRESIGKQQSTIRTTKGTTFIIKNTNRNLGKDGCIGGKTGYTAAAGRCLVAFYNRNGREIMGVVMGSVYDQNDSFVFNDMKKIIDWSYAAKPSILHTANSVITTKSINYRPLVFVGPEKSINVPIVVKEDVKYYSNSFSKDNLKQTINLNNINISSLRGNNSIGTLTVTEKNMSKNYKLYANMSIASLIKDNLLIYGALFAVILVAAGIIGFTVKKIRDLTKRKKRGKYI
jgi:D-alanyl-D-alanine carboxypeptidase